MWKWCGVGWIWSTEIGRKKGRADLVEAGELLPRGLLTMADPHMDTCNGGPHSRCDVVGGTVLGDAVVDWCALNIRVCVRMSVPV